MADMNITAARTGLTPTVWDSLYFDEYVRKNQFAKSAAVHVCDIFQIDQNSRVALGDFVADRISEGSNGVSRGNFS